MNRLLLRCFVFFILVAFLNGIQIQAANRHDGGGDKSSGQTQASSDGGGKGHSGDVKRRSAKSQNKGSSGSENSQQGMNSQQTQGSGNQTNQETQNFNNNGKMNDNGGSQPRAGAPKSPSIPSGHVSNDVIHNPQPQIQHQPQPEPAQPRPASSAPSSSLNSNKLMQQAVATYKQGSSSSNIVKYNYKINNIQIKSPAITQSMKPGVNFYNQGNYVGAIQSLKEVVKKEPKNEYAKYYLALAYTKLGYQDLATEQYQDIINSGSNYALSYYSQHALDCTGNPGNPACLAPEKETIQKLQAQNNAQVAKQLKEVQQQRQQQLKNYNASVKQYNEDLAQYNKNKEQFYKDQKAKEAQGASDIQKFIESGQKVHPAAMDRITREKMEIKIQEAQKKALEAGR